MRDQINTKSQKVDILGVHFDNVTMLDMIENVKNFFYEETCENLFIVTANPEIVDYATEHVTYRQLINQADYIVPDGTGIVKASNRLKTPLKRRIPGIELMNHCMKIAHANHQKVYLLGATNEIVEQAHEKLQQRYPQAQFEHHHGYIDLNEETVIKRIKRFNPDYIFVGMGFPLQEQWIEKHKHSFEHTLLMGVGGSLEVFSGAKKRAPKLFRRLNIEWVYRLLIDWRRIGRMRSIPKFMFKVLKVQRKNKKKAKKRGR
ncbi:teichoic acid biosynthesis protein [Staphylococcus petrasii]|uniref:N-acetylglucosaminyldiphosphoundecaprenol N-acetyl-beta-D-mannosaminyltransferase n=1 Tax=Staphylococcus petrasii TaxID=1276936 RepID=A0A380G2I8_9STAP|nr:N-acetylglucosaminyldiphosphoundecaprenol N-acetyl-beta-D-mannosaminyltransferase TarA [Staphylococcus petrasii]PNZ25200.1 N-acetylmannosaminyltransferase [Staphylococcus petrasii]TGE12930.1 glycosyltransferase [Staphylococcus petrasii]TGE18720.1 glycosyltransferase [Staphylococcus petrasii]SUM44982.1 teichoic acid biosynthesis protein [Staphylococcus petrasii]